MTCRSELSSAPLKPLGSGTLVAFHLKFALVLLNTRSKGVYCIRDDGSFRAQCKVWCKVGICIAFVHHALGSMPCLHKVHNMNV
jgi:hypothetical protein